MGEPDRNVEIRGLGRRSQFVRLAWVYCFWNEWAILFYETHESLENCFRWCLPKLFSRVHDSTLYIIKSPSVCIFYDNHKLNTSGSPLLRQRCLSLSINVNFAYDVRTFN